MIKLLLLDFDGILSNGKKIILKVEFAKPKNCATKTLLQ